MTPTVDPIHSYPVWFALLWEIALRPFFSRAAFLVTCLLSDIKENFTYIVSRHRRMRAALLFKLCLVTGGAVAAAYYAIASVQISGLVAHDFTAADVILERCSFHLVRPGWIAGSDQFDILFRWSVAEIQARLAVLFLLWILTVSAFVWQYLRRRRHEHVG